MSTGIVYSEGVKFILITPSNDWLFKITFLFISFTVLCYLTTKPTVLFRSPNPLRVDHFT